MTTTITPEEARRMYKNGWRPVAADVNKGNLCEVLATNRYSFAELMLYLRNAAGLGWTPTITWERKRRA